MKVVAQGVLVLSLGVVLTGCAAFTPPQSTQPSPTPLTDSYTQARERLFTKLEIEVPERNVVVTLDRNKLSADFGDNQSKKAGEYGTVSIGDQVVESEGVSFSTIAVNYEGLGETFYLVAFEPRDTGWKMSASHELGQMIRMQSIKVNPNGLTTQYLEHSPGQNLAETPTVQVDRSFQYQDQELIELKKF